MPTVVIIKGSPTPSIHLGKDKTQRVVLTPHVQSLINKGYVTVVEQWEHEAQVPEPAPAPKKYASGGRLKKLPPQPIPEPTQEEPDLEVVEELDPEPELEDA